MSSHSKRPCYEGATRAEPLYFRAIKDLATKKIRFIRLHSDNRLFEVPAGIISDRLNCIPLFRPTVQCDVAKSLIARKDKGSARVL